jgi:hypothetical protein
MVSSSPEASGPAQPASPVAPATTAPVSIALVAPGIWRRMACWLYEGMLLFAVVFVSGWLFSTLGQMRRRHGRAAPSLQAFLFVVFGVYFV